MRSASAAASAALRAASASRSALTRACSASLALRRSVSRCSRSRAAAMRAAWRAANSGSFAGSFWRAFSRSACLALAAVSRRSVKVWPWFFKRLPWLFRRLGGLLPGALAVFRVEEALAQTNRLRRDLDQLVLLDVGDRLFEAHLARRREAHSLVLAGGADVGELLALQHVDFEVVAAAMLADHHALVNGHAGIAEHRPALLEVPHRIGDSVAFRIGDQPAVAPAGDRPAIGTVFVEDTVHHAGAAGVGQELAVIADQAARGGVEHQPRLAGARGTHVLQLALAHRDLLDHDAGI